MNCKICGNELDIGDEEGGICEFCRDGLREIARI